MHPIKRTIASGDKRIIQAFDGEWTDVAGPMTVDETREWLIRDIGKGELDESQGRNKNQGKVP